MQGYYGRYPFRDCARAEHFWQADGHLGGNLCFLDGSVHPSKSRFTLTFGHVGGLMLLDDVPSRRDGGDGRESSER